MGTYRLMGLPEELRLELEQSNPGITTEAARLIYEASVNEAVNQVQQITQGLKEVQGIIGPHGSVTRLQAGGVNITPGTGIGIFQDGVYKTRIFPDGSLVIGSDITQPYWTTEYFFTVDEIYNGEQFRQGDYLIGDNSSGKPNQKYIASTGQLQFRYGTTVRAYIGTDGKIYAAGGDLWIDEYGIWCRNQEGVFGFQDTGGNIGNLYLYSDDADNIGLINALAGKGIKATIKLTDNSTPYWKLIENPDVDNQTLFQILPGAAGIRTQIGYDHFIDGLPTGGAGSATVWWNYNGYDIDQVWKDDNGDTALKVDAGAHTVTAYGKNVNQPTYLPFGVYANISPITGDAYPYSATIDRNMSLVKWTQGLFVSTTNNGSNYWNVRLVSRINGTIKTLNTSALSANTPSQISATTFDITNLTTSDIDIYIYCFKTGSPGDLYIFGPTVEITT